MTTITAQKTCAHQDCDIEIADHELACRHHWYELPTKLRNRIWKHFRNDPGGPLHLDAIREAITVWNPPPVKLRCHSCMRYTDFTDAKTGLPVCLVCATAGMDTTVGPGECSRCGNEADLLVSIDTDRPPHICVDCTIRDLKLAEAAQ